MLTSIDISNYRGFGKYRVDGLARVNLFGGRNNSGKTAILEAVHLLTSGGDPNVLVDTAKRRGEFVAGSREHPDLLDVSHFFHGHDLTIGTSFTIRGQNGLPPVTVLAVPLDEVDQEPFDLVRGFRPVIALRITPPQESSRRVFSLLLSEEGAMAYDPRRKSRWFVPEERRDAPAIVFIAPDSMQPGSLGSMWNQVTRDKREAEVHQAMRILESDLQDIVFQTGEFTPRFTTGRSGVLVGLSGDARRVPLGSMGDGMRRLLTLSISLIHAKGGYLLVDEIDTGLHYSTMADMWKLVIETAMANDLQVFATTHSKDCYLGLEVLCQSDPTKIEQVAVHKIDRAIPHSIPFVGKKFMRAIQGDVELR